MEVFNDVLIYIIEALADVLIGFATWGIVELVQWFSKKTGIQIATDTVAAVVGETFQTFVEPLKKGLVEGKGWDSETMAEALQISLTNTKELLSDKVLKTLKKMVKGKDDEETEENLDKYLIALIEDAVSNQ